MVHHLDIANEGRVMRRATVAAVAVALTLVAVKAVAFVITGSVAVLGSLVDSALDLAASSVNFLAVRAALEPPDKEHRFGHGKAEPIAGLFQAAVISGSAVFLALESIDRLVTPTPIAQGPVGIGVSVFAIVLTIALVGYQKHAIRVSGSVAITADRLHYVGDVLLNLAVIAAIAIATFGGFPHADGLFGLGIAGYIAFAAMMIGKGAIDMLMDREFSEEERERIFNLVLGNPEVRGMHDLKTRRSGTQNFIQMHIELEPELRLSEAHAIADEVEATVGENFPRTEIIIHTDPLGVEGHQLTEKELLE